MIIRPARVEDAAALVAIYAPYVEETAITFEVEVPTIEAFQGRIMRVLEKYPYFVAEENGSVMGYAYASTFIARPAADWTVETSIYIDRSMCHRGLGRQLHSALENALRQQGIVNMCAAIAAPCGMDAHLDENSLRFHAHMGYRKVAHFDRVGYKFDTWYDLVWMQKRIGEEETLLV